MSRFNHDSYLILWSFHMSLSKKIALFFVFTVVRGCKEMHARPHFLSSFQIFISNLWFLFLFRFSPRKVTYFKELDDKKKCFSFSSEVLSRKKYRNSFMHEFMPQTGQIMPFSDQFYAVHSHFTTTYSWLSRRLCMGSGTRSYFQP